MYSFDVFDTLITRTTATPWGIFALMRDRLKLEKQIHNLDEYVVDNFYGMRIHSEELARKAGSFQHVEEVTLHDIYKAMAVCGCISAEQIKYLCKLEQETEVANVVPIPENIQRLKGLVEQGERVVLISDMYLPENTIRRMLLQADDIFETIPLYVSSEYGKRKTTGNLYRLIKELEQIDISEWTHIGDNIYQDIEISFRLGIRPEFVERIGRSNFENELLEKYGDDSRLQLMTGTAIRAERSNEAVFLQTGDIKQGISESRCNAYHIGCRYAGPVLYSYGEWIIDQAEKKGIDRLYFIARDGYLVKRIVDVILKSRKSGIATSYIYGSRKAWRMPSLSKENYNLYQMIFWSHVRRIKTLEDLAAVIHVPLQKLYEYLPGSFASNRKNMAISQYELEYVMRELSESEAFKEYHLKELDEERKLVRQYLSQEIDTSDDRFAFVDVSGGGLTQGCLKELLKDRYNKSIHTFFFKIDRVNLVEGSITDTFVPGFLENNLTIEMMCRAPHGQTRGYEKRDGKIVPVLEETEDRQIIEHGFYEYEKGIFDFSERMYEVSAKTGVKIGSMKNILLYIKHIAEEPTEDVLEYFASMPSSESGRGDKVVEYAPKLTKEEIKTIFLKRTNEPIEFFYKGTDLNYSLMRATEEEKALAERYKKERNGTLGRFYRQEAEKELNAMRKQYGRAALYPVRLLDEKVVLYGAGKFGQDLYKRLLEDDGHEVALWVDKNAAACRQQGLANVQNVSEIRNASFDQLVIAVVDKKLAEEIQEELVQTGMEREKIIWLSPNQIVEWKVEGIG